MPVSGMAPGVATWLAVPQYADGRMVAAVWQAAGPALVVSGGCEDGMRRWNPPADTAFC